MTFPAQIGMHVAVALALCGVVWLGVVVVEMLFKTRPQGGGKSAGSRNAFEEWRDRVIDNWPNDPIDRHIDTAAALLQPDAPHLPMSELDAAVPSRPITEEEDRKWAGIVAGYRFTAAPVVPGGES